MGKPFNTKSYVRIIDNISDIFSSRFFADFTKLESVAIDIFFNPFDVASDITSAAIGKHFKLINTDEIKLEIINLQNDII